jgi:hypothetical protein
VKILRATPTRWPAPGRNLALSKAGYERGRAPRIGGARVPRSGEVDPHARREDTVV